MRWKNITCPGQRLQWTIWRVLRDSSLQAATDYQSEIVDTSYVVEKMQTVTDDAGRLKEAQDMINKLESGINEISDQLFILIRHISDTSHRTMSPLLIIMRPLLNELT